MVVVTVRQGGQESNKEFRGCPESSFVEHKLEQQYGPGELVLHNAVLAPTEVLQPAETSYAATGLAGGWWPGGPAGRPACGGHP